MAHILIIDPTLDVGALIVEYLSKVYGFDAIHVSEFETADRLLDANKFDAVVMEPATNFDQHLRVNVGLPWYKFKQAQNFKLPIIVFSAVGDLITDSGVYDCPIINKPNFAQLGKKLQDLLPKSIIKKNSLTIKHAISIFISYAREDVASARLIYGILGQDGYKPWLDEVDIIPGHDWDLEVEKAIEDAQFVIACMSRQSVSKEGHFQKELKVALNKLDKMPEGAIYLIPVRLDECKVPRRFSHIHHFDFYKESGIQMLRKSISHGCIVRRLLDPSN